ncbi:hypothetical protein AK812_SmicGene37548 [Symbiodinium microadriaticum]|uniref:Uncharacterized protein n=1 Tax=Symbiodinium microadriaticum TaxID=2951 RepID=A0A1Q9CFZ8_SYMMI|nr:hypothetical protein AK812_SmicGene37548 [Symbiodinium microadriaticum]
MQIVILLFVQQLFSAEGYSAFSDRDELRSTLIDWENNPGNRPTIESTYGPIEDWDVSSVTSFVALFSGLRNFNEEIGNWETSQVTDMSFTFSSATAFNKDIGSWKTPRVTTMSNMFANARAFNQDIGSWDTSQVTDMTNMFNGGRAFNGKVGSWDVSSVTLMRFMFRDAEAFNQPIGKWVPSQATNMRGMFEGAADFNQPLNSWDVSSVGDFNSMFNGATVFNQCLDSWTDQINSTSSNNVFTGTSCPDEDCTVCPPRAWCEDLDALDYALLNKKGKLAARQCILHSLIEDYKFPAKLPSWSRVATKAGLTSVFCFIMVSLVVAAAAWRIRRQGSLVYEAL